jgi:GNAT superfamily N-acetyltransferase
MGVIQAPTLLNAEHVLSGFDCGHTSLNRWLQKRALQATQVGGSARTYVACNSAKEVVAYYALASGSIDRDEVPGRIRRNAPNPIPVILLARLAVDLRYTGQGVGRGLLKDALLRVYQAAEHIGVRAVLVHALDEQARTFYLKHGFYESPTHEFTLMLTLSEIHQSLN